MINSNARHVVIPPTLFGRITGWVEFHGLPMCIAFVAGCGFTTAAAWLWSRFL